MLCQNNYKEKKLGKCLIKCDTGHIWKPGNILTPRISNFKEIAKEFLPYPRSQILLNPHIEVPYVITTKTR